jgi:hypothetical protein
MQTLMQRLFGILLLVLAIAAHAQPAGEIEFARGVGFAQSPGQMPRTLAKGMALHEGDRLTTAEAATAIIKLQDGTRMTLRPNSLMVLDKYQFQQGADNNSMVMDLVRGGFRAITGLMTKNAPDAAKIKTRTALVGIRGTDFDARLCGPECSAEAADRTEKARPNAVLASAKLIAMAGDISVRNLTNAKRQLAEGASVYPGETIDMGANAKGVLVFRDDSRVTLGASTQVKVDGFVYDERNPGDGRFLLSLLSGSMRALTGLIGKASPANVKFATPTALVGIRGTGLDMDCAAVDSCSFFTWQGSIEVTPKGQTVQQLIPAGTGLLVGPEGIKPLTAPTLENLPRPDTVPANIKQLFTSGGVSVNDEGLFVFVRDGHIEVTSSKETLHLGRGETGFAGSDGLTGRPVTMPLFIQFDKVPMPNTPNPTLLSVINEASKTPARQCN